jgi:hypothetical protein
VSKKPKKDKSLEELKQKYLLATHDRERKILLGLIKLKEPGFKG